MQLFVIIWDLLRCTVTKQCVNMHKINYDYAILMQLKFFSSAFLFIYLEFGRYNDRFTVRGKSTPFEISNISA